MRTDELPPDVCACLLLDVALPSQARPLPVPILCGRAVQTHVDSVVELPVLTHKICRTTSNAQFPWVMRQEDVSLGREQR